MKHAASFCLHPTNSNFSLNNMNVVDTIFFIINLVMGESGLSASGPLLE